MAVASVVFPVPGVPVTRILGLVLLAPFDRLTPPGMVSQENTEIGSTNYPSYVFLLVALSRCRIVCSSATQSRSQCTRSVTLLTPPRTRTALGSCKLYQNIQNQTDTSDTSPC